MQEDGGGTGGGTLGRDALRAPSCDGVWRDVRVWNTVDVRICVAGRTGR